MSDLNRDEAVAQLADAVRLWRLSPGNAQVVVDTAVRCLLVDVDSPSLRELAGVSPQDSQFVLEPLIEGTLHEMEMHDVLVDDAEQGALGAVLRAFKRGEFSARDVAHWAHTAIGHDGDVRCQVFVDLDDMYDAVDHSDYDTADLNLWTDEEADAFLEGRPSPGRTTIWRTPRSPQGS